MTKIMTRGIRAVYADASDPVALINDFTKSFAEFKDANAKALEEVKAAGEKQTVEAVKKAEEAVASVTKIAANLAEIEQKVADKLASGTRFAPGTVGDIVINSAEYKAVLGNVKPGHTPGAGFSLRVEANTITGQEGSPPENSPTLVRPDRKPGIVPGAFRSLRVADMLVSVPTSSNSWEFVRENVWTNNAAETAEGDGKPESVLTFEQLTVPVRTIAHYIKASNQILADAPALRAYIDNRLRHGVDQREDTQLVTGNGTGQNLSGMTNAGNFTAFTPVTGDQQLDSLNRAKYAIIGADYAPTGILMNPADWGAIERLKDGDENYLIGNPFGSIVPVLWGLPIVVTNAMTPGKFLMADFITSYEHVMRMSTVVELGYVNDDFTKNLVTIRAEKRAALASIRPASTRYGDLVA